MEGAISVVAANDGPQVQTREHVILAKEVGIPYMIVFLNKVDLKVNEEMKELVELEILELLDLMVIQVIYLLLGVLQDVH